MPTKDEIKTVIKYAWEHLREKEINGALYEAVINTLSENYGTEYIAECFVEMTKAGEF